MGIKKRIKRQTSLFFSKSEKKSAIKFGTFGGVFTPTLLTILGVIMYLRLGWVVGQVGLLGAWGIILISFTITLATAMSMSSITTNIRIGAGGAYAIISQALGLEVGGSLGIPRYISQGLAVTMYIFGFREGWLMIYPAHDPFMVDLAVFIILFGIAYISASLAIKTQYIIMAVILLSLVSIVMAAFSGSMQYESFDVIKFEPLSRSEGSSIGFWVVFAVFFPASTGIMAGANMSGELKNPQKSIPVGTMWAIGISLVIYLGLAYWVARTASNEELLNNLNVMIDKSYFPPLVIAGVLGATFSSALASILGSSRILFAMGQHRVLPKSKWLEFQDSRGQPRNAMLITGVMIFATMLLRDLNAVAPLVTMFFLITYAMLNVVVIIEQRLGHISFRPTYKVNRWIPWVGLIGSVLVMFIINPTLSLVSWALVFLVYSILSKQKLEIQFEDVRSGLFTSFAEWAAKKTAEDSHMQQRSWKANLLVPVTDYQTIQGAYSLIKDISYPKGSAVLMGIGKSSKNSTLKAGLDRLSKAFKKDSLYSSVTIMKTDKFSDGVNFGIQALSASFFRPNLIFLNMQEPKDSIDSFVQIFDESKKLKIGIMLYYPHAKAVLGQQQNVNIWIKDHGPEWSIDGPMQNSDLAMLIAYKLKQNWNADIRLITIIRNEDEAEKAKHYLDRFIELTRLPIHETVVKSGNFYDELENAPNADINIFGMAEGFDHVAFSQIADTVNSSCLFVRDSGYENVFA